MKVQYVGELAAPSGYSKSIRNNMRALLEAGILVENLNKDFDIVKSEDLGEFWKKNIRNIYEPDGIDHDVRIIHMTPQWWGHYAIDDIPNVGFVAWETDRIPGARGRKEPSGNDWVTHINRMNAVMVPSEFSKRVLEDSGITVPIYVVPHPIDLEMYSPGPGGRFQVMNQYGKEQQDVTTFLAVGQFNRRKNFEGLLAAWTHQFRERTDVRLIIKTYHATNSDPEIPKNEVAAMRRAFLRDGLKMAPNVAVITDFMTDVEMVDLYKSCDAFVLIPYGEGFGLPFQEAMACGKPCIYPYSTAMPEFIPKGLCYHVDVTQEPVYGMEYYHYGIEQIWWRPMLITNDHGVGVCERLEDVVFAKQNNTLAQIGADCRKQIESLHSFSRIGGLMKTVLEEIIANGK